MAATWNKVSWDCTDIVYLRKSSNNYDSREINIQTDIISFDRKMLKLNIIEVI